MAPILPPFFQSCPPVKPSFGPWFLGPLDQQLQAELEPSISPQWQGSDLRGSAIRNEAELKAKNNFRNLGIFKRGFSLSSTLQSFGERLPSNNPSKEGHSRSFAEVASKLPFRRKAKKHFLLKLRCFSVNLKSKQFLGLLYEQ